MILSRRYDHEPERHGSLARLRLSRGINAVHEMPTVLDKPASLFQQIGIVRRSR
jgi:hypothetical protein